MRMAALGGARRFFKRGSRGYLHLLERVVAEVDLTLWKETVSCFRVEDQVNQFFESAIADNVVRAADADIDLGGVGAGGRRDRDTGQQEHKSRPAHQGGPTNSD